MRTSPLQHPLAVLRTQLGLGQKDFGDMVGRHWRTIQSVELGKLPLSAKLAERICEETGVGFEWLMNGDPEAMIVDDRGLKWKKELYFDAQGKKLLPGTTLFTHYASDLFNLALAQVCAAAVAAAESPTLRTYSWKLSNAIDQAMKELPDYENLVQVFRCVLLDNVKNMQEGRKVMIDYAVKRIQATKELKPKHAKKKRLKAEG
jgi:transcriptional regulator with XRE-family HTH domain